MLIERTTTLSEQLNETHPILKQLESLEKEDPNFLERGRTKILKDLSDRRAKNFSNN